MWIIRSELLERFGEIAAGYRHLPRSQARYSFG